MVQQVEKLRAELDVRSFVDRESLVHNQIKLAEFRPVQEPALQVAEGAGAGNGKRRRIEERPVIAEVRIDAGYQVGPPHPA